MRKFTYRGLPLTMPPPVEGPIDNRTVGMHHWFYDSPVTFFTCVDYLWYCHSGVLKDAGSPLKVLEMFAGIGVSSSPLVGKMSRQLAIDHNPEGLEAFKANHPKAEVITGDTYVETPKALAKEKFDYVLYEHNAITFYRAMTEAREAELFDAVMASRPEYILFVDSATLRVQLHLKTYSKFYGQEVLAPKENGHRSFLDAVSNFMYKKYGYSILRVGHDHMNYGVVLKRDLKPYEFPILDTRTITDLNELIEVTK